MSHLTRGGPVRRDRNLALVMRRISERAETLSRILTQLSVDEVVSVTSRNTVRIPSRRKLQCFVDQAGKT